MTKIKTVFVVDDSELVLKQNAKLLSHYNFKVRTFSNPLEALESMEQTPPELILLDYFMPEMNGDSFMIKVSERLLHSHDWQVFLVTSHNFSSEEKLSMLTLGITQIFDKPLNQEQLANAITEFENL